MSAQTVIDPIAAALTLEKGTCNMQYEHKLNDKELAALEHFNASLPKIMRTVNTTIHRATKGDDTFGHMACIAVAVPLLVGSLTYQEGRRAKLIAGKLNEQLQKHGVAYRLVPMPGASKPVH